MLDIKKKIKKENLPLLLLILDGWGIWDKQRGNAIAQARTPIIDIFVLVQSFSDKPMVAK